MEAERNQNSPSGISNAHTEENLFVFRKGCQVFQLHGRTRTLSTSPLNGGIRTDLRAIVNINCLGEAYECEMREETYEKELMRQVQECGIDPQEATALSTAAWTELSAVKNCSFRDLTVTAVVSGGIDHNATAPGDPAGYYEENGQFYLISEEKNENSGIREHDGEIRSGIPKPGTLNLFLFVNRELTEAAMVRALMICSEAKESVVRELLLGSCYSDSLASGSGTDGCVIVSQMDSGSTLTDASGHSKLGELIGKAVKGAVREALLNQSGANGARQFRVLERVKRFGITQGSLYDHYKKQEQNYKRMGVCFNNASAFDECLQRLGQNSNFVLVISLYIHLLDQSRWGLIMQGEVLREGKRMLKEMLYVRKGRYLKDVYPAEAFELNHFNDSENELSDPLYLLKHYMLLWLAKSAE